MPRTPDKTDLLDLWIDAAQAAYRAVDRKDYIAARKDKTKPLGLRIVATSRHSHCAVCVLDNDWLTTADNMLYELATDWPVEFTSADVDEWFDDLDVQAKRMLEI